MSSVQEALSDIDIAACTSFHYSVHPLPKPSYKKIGVTIRKKWAQSSLSAKTCIFNCQNKPSAVKVCSNLTLLGQEKEECTHPVNATLEPFATCHHPLSKCRFPMQARTCISHMKKEEIRVDLWRQSFPCVYK